MSADLPPERAFVIQLASDCSPELSTPRGRVEHVSSGRSTHFESREELWDFLSRTLTNPGSGAKTAEPPEMSR